jgi:phosphoglycolate phosphatase
VTDRLHGLDLVVFDKDGTLIEFHAMWSGWAVELADRLEAATGRPLRASLYASLGYDAATGRAIAGGRLAATPMARLRELTLARLVDDGVEPVAAERAMAIAWHAPDPVALARPVTDLRALFTTMRGRGMAIAIATTDDREPTERTLAALGVTHLVDATVCADDGIPVKPAGDMVRHLATSLSRSPSRTAVVGDSVADLQMGRAAGAARVYGVLTGVGTVEDLAPLADEVLGSVADLLAGPSDLV